MSDPNPKPPIPSPAALAGRLAQRPVTPPAEPVHSESAKHGKVAEDGTVYVVVEGEEIAVGSYPGATPDEALQYFARKYDELAGTAELLHQRLSVTDVTAKEIAEGLAAVKEHRARANVVGDLPALDARIAEIEAELAAKREQESAARAAARDEAAQAREELVAEAERIAGQPPGSTQWKTSGDRMRALLEDWKNAQRSGPKLDKATETALWQRFSHARNHFDKGRRAFFAQLETTRGEARSAKETLVAEAEALAKSTDWNATARAFKDLMGEWRRAGRAARNDDDALWARFKAAQDSFFAAKDAVAAAEDDEFRANLQVKEALLAEASALLPVTDLDEAKAKLRVLQDKWDAAGKVPRADLERVEKAMRRVETAVREAEDARWRSSNPELQARAASLTSQLEAKLAALRADQAKAEAAGNTAKAAKLAEDIAAQQAWLDQINNPS